MSIPYDGCLEGDTGCHCVVGSIKPANGITHQETTGKIKEGCNCTHEFCDTHRDERDREYEDIVRKWRECLKNKSDEVDWKYGPLRKVLDEAYNQAAHGKGKDRHASGKPFLEQPIFVIADMVGSGYHPGQAIKKIEESTRLPWDMGRNEILGAIVYLSAMVIYGDMLNAD